MKPSRQIWSISRASARDYCESLVRQKDRSSYIINKYVPAQGQDAYMGLRAFNLETAKICDSFTQPALAKVRLDFWKTAVRTSFQTEKESQPVCALLSTFAFTKSPLLTLIQSRETVFARSNVLFRDLDDMAAYGEGTFSQLNYSTLELLYSLFPQAGEYIKSNSELDSHINTIMAHLGQAIGITSLIKATLFYSAKRNFVPLPVDIMASHGVSPQSLIDQSQDVLQSKELSDVVFETATRANDHIISANSLLSTLLSELKTVPDPVKIAAMVGVPAKLYLEQLESHNFNLSKAASSPEWRLPWRSYRFFKKGQF